IIEQWNFATVWEAVADRYPSRTAVMHGDVALSWAEFDRGADGLAATLLGAGLVRQSKIAQLQRNSAAYLQVVFADFKASLVPVNTNFRYLDDELMHVWEDSDTEAVVFDAEFTEIVSRVRLRLPDVKIWLRVGGDDSCPSWAVPFSAATANRPLTGLRENRSGDDLMLLYTGGTTGKPKGVMWRQDDLFRALEAAQGASLTDDLEAQGFVERYAARAITVLTAAPLMHGTACWFAMPILSRGGTIVTLTSASLNPVELLDTVVERKVKGICIAGNAFAKPILETLDAHPGRWDLSSLRVITTSGAILSEENKQALLSYSVNSTIVDSLGSSESGSIGRATSSRDSHSRGASFTLSANARVLDEDDDDVVPGSGRPGRLALSGFIPVGYYGDPKKTKETFVTIDGVRFVVTGDLVEVDADGRVTFLGRGSSCINTAGEKVYPEEVEEVIKKLPGVSDAGVFGVPDERLGQAVTAVVHVQRGLGVAEDDVKKWVRSQLAGYKTPRRIVITPDFPRGPNGKLEYAKLRDIVEALRESDQ
ncbi:MAG TPA: acyl-CoA synthetase, partial [Microbacteriaceae bacterium]|nr:acyl-CoA synthetase [Microbacteriaceae bacterium]